MKNPQISQMHADEKNAASNRDAGFFFNKKNPRQSADEKTLDGFFKSRPWIWIIVGYLFGMGAVITALVISIKHAPQEVPLHTAAPPQIQHAPHEPQ